MSAGSVNKAILIGRAFHGPESRTTSAGVPQAVFGLATNEIWFDKATNEKREKTIFHRVVVYGPLAKVVGKYLRKGARVYVEGQIETRRWKGKDGQPGENWTTEIIVQGWSGQLTILDHPKDEPTALSVNDGANDLADARTPQSIKRSRAKYGDLDDAPDQDHIDRGLPFLA
jgi:single-strand DNA-binding protein